jgi:hypothetical protein
LRIALGRDATDEERRFAVKLFEAMGVFIW